MYDLRCLSLRTHTSALCKRPATADDAPIETKGASGEGQFSFCHWGTSDGKPHLEHHGLTATREQSPLEVGGPQDSGLGKIQLLAPDTTRVA